MKKRQPGHIGRCSEENLDLIVRGEGQLVGDRALVALGDGLTIIVLRDSDQRLESLSATDRIGYPDNQSH